MLIVFARLIPSDELTFLFRHEFWTLKAGEKKIDHEPDTRMYISLTTRPEANNFVGTANTEMFTIRAEDHTMGNLIRDALLAMPEVTFAAYKVRSSKKVKYHTNRRSSAPTLSTTVSSFAFKSTPSPR